MDFVSSYLLAFEAFLKQHSFSKDETSIYEPVDYILQLGGKRVRPVALLMAYDSFSASINEALPAALAIEVFHNFTLMHDDIMDNAPLRRGKPTVHEKYGQDAGILSGDVMLIKAYELLSSYKPELASSLIKVFNKMAIEVCEGQHMDMEFEKRNDVTIPEYLKMIEYKTSVLLAASLKMGALLGGASEQDAYHSYNFGLNLGIAFQIQDDVLDTFGDPKVGKQAAGDIIQNKKTYLYLKALELGSEEELSRLAHWYRSTPEDPRDKIEEVSMIFRNNHVVTYADEVKSEYKNLALSHLAMIDMPSDKKKAFVMLAEFLLNREL